MQALEEDLGQNRGDPEPRGEPPVGGGNLDEKRPRRVESVSLEKEHSQPR